MSKTVTKLIRDSLVAKFYIHPVPQSLAQSSAICSHLSSFTQLPLIQYRHARDPSTSSRLNSFRVVFNEPIQAGSDSQTSKDNANIWKNHAQLVNQVPFHQRSTQFQARVKAHDFLKEGSTASTILESIPTFTYTPKDTPSKPPSHSSLFVSSPPSELELKLLQTTHITLDAQNNVIPIDKYLDLKYLNPNEEYIDSCTTFTLDLALMSRDPDVITFASKNSLLDHYKIDRKQPFSQRLKSLDRLRDNALHGFSGKLK